MAGSGGTIIIAPNWLGDLVMALPALKIMRAGLPAPFCVIVRPGLVDLASLGDGELVVTTGKGLQDTWRMMRWLWHFRPDVAVSFPRSSRAAAMVAVSRARIRVGRKGREGEWAYNRLVQGRVKARHMAREYLNLAAALGLEGAMELPAMDHVAGEIPAAVQENIDNTVVLAPGARYGPAKQWPADSFAALARELVRRFSLRVALVGGAPERPLLAQIAAAARSDVVNLAGETTLPELLSMLRRCALFVGNDSGVAHVAALAGARVVVIFGSTNPAWTRPLGSRVCVIYKGLSCSPCLERRCPLGHTNCLKEITVEHVLEACVREGT